MENKRSATKVKLVCAFAIASAFVAFDISGYVKASLAFGEELDLNNMATEFSRDEVALHKCDSLFPAAGKLTSAWRDCWVGIGPSLHSVEFTSVYAIRMYDWLDGHRDDVQARQAGLNAIEVGWKAFAARKQHFDARDALSDAHDRSLLLRLRDGSIGGDQMRKALTTMLEWAELGLLAPDVRRLQLERQVKLAGGMQVPREKS